MAKLKVYLSGSELAFAAHDVDKYARQSGFNREIGVLTYSIDRICQYDLDVFIQQLTFAINHDAIDADIIMIEVDDNEVWNIKDGVLLN